MSLLEAVSGLALRYVSRERFLAWRAAYHSARAKLHPLMRTVYGSFDAPALRTHLEGRVGGSFQILMVHSSVNHMKPMYTSTPLDLARMLIDFCGPDRTLVMPAFCFDEAAFGEAAGTEAQPARFDLRRTPSRMGLVTELFRRTKGVVQSRHPVYRVAALGPLAEALTQVHHAEDLLGDEFPVPARRGKSLSVTLVDGKEEIAMELPGQSLAWRRDMWKLRSIMDRERLQEWTFHHVPFFSTRAADVTAAIVEAARRGVTLYEKP